MKVQPYRLLLLLLLADRVSLAGQTAAASVSAAPDAAQLPGIMTWVFGIGCTVLFAVALLYIVRVNQFLYRRLMDFEAVKHGVTLPNETAAADALPQGDDFWTRMRKKYWEDAAPIEREGDIMLHHNYDGIRELDNRLPPWWVNMFLLCIIWSVGYMWYYHWGGDGPDQQKEYEMEMETAKRQIAIAVAGKAAAVDESNVTALADAGAIGEGELIYKGVCAACHGQQGEGGVGPNLTDAHWLHGGGIKNVFKTIKYGVPEKGMIAWQSQLKPSDMQKVASYILTMQGTNPPNGKEPQGEIWQEAVEKTADSTAVSTQPN
jgi:cytochrome c oxidase cbb3-type subunit III